MCTTSVCICGYIYRCIHIHVVSIYTYCAILLLENNPLKSKILFPDNLLLASISFILLMIYTFFWDVLFCPWDFMDLTVLLI